LQRDSNVGGKEMTVFSVCVPTYNRPECIPQLIDCFSQQTFESFELIIVDDGSVEDICSLVKSLAPESLIWCCLKVENGGRARALNKAFDKAKGELIIIFDDDDYMPPDGLATLWHVWESIPAHDRENYWGVAGTCTDVEGRILGLPFPTEGDFSYAQWLNHGSTFGDKKEAIRTALISDFRFRVYPSERRCPTSLLFMWMSQSYRIRVTNRPCAVKTYRDDGLSKDILESRRRSGLTSQEYYRSAMRLTIDVNVMTRLRWASNASRFFLHGLFRRGSSHRRRELKNVVVLVVGVPVGLLLWLKDLMELQKGRKK